MHAFWFEARLAWRSLWRSPGFALAGIGILTAGLALCLYAFGAMASIVLRPLPFQDPHRLVHLELATENQDDSMAVPMHTFLDLRAAQTSLRSLEGFYQGTVNLSGDFRPERYDGGFVTPGTFRVLGVEPVLGRSFLAEEEQPGQNDVVMLGYRLWQQRFGGDPALVGQAIRANGRDVTVVGVMPPGFAFPFNNQVWLPLDTDVSDIERGDGMSLEVFGRLQDGVTIEQARAELDALVQRVAAMHPNTLRSDRAALKPYRDEFLSSQTRQIVSTMLAAGVLVLLVACANVANLMLARGAARAHDTAIRGALGASRRRLVVSAMAESALLVAFALPIAFALASIGGEATMRAVRESGDPPPYWMTEWSVDGLVVAAALAVGAATALLAGLLPGLRMAGRGTAGLRGARGGIGRLGRSLVVVEVALSLALVVTGALVVRGAIELNRVDIGARTEGVLTARLGLFDTLYPDEDDVRLFHQKLVAELESRPGVESASLTTAVPLSEPGFNWVWPEHLEVPDPMSTPGVRQLAVTPGHFETFGLVPLEGRVFRADDDEEARPVALVSRSLAGRLWGEREVVGSRLKLAQAGDEQADWIEVVGVVPDVVQTQHDLETDAVYVPLAQRPSRFVTVAVAFAGSAVSGFDVLSGAVAELDRDLPLYWVRTMEDWVALAAFDHHLLARIFGVLGALALLLAMAGLYAVLAFSVSQRTREIGVRRALGATDGGIARMVLRQGLRQTATGLVIGLVLAAAFARALSGILYGIGGLDPASVLAVMLLFAVTAAGAALLPTRRALSVEPVTALRYD